MKEESDRVKLRSCQYECNPRGRARPPGAPHVQKFAPATGRPGGSSRACQSGSGRDPRHNKDRRFATARPTRERERIGTGSRAFWILSEPCHPFPATFQNFELQVRVGNLDVTAGRLVPLAGSSPSVRRGRRSRRQGEGPRQPLPTEFRPREPLSMTVKERAIETAGPGLIGCDGPCAAMTIGGKKTVINVVELGVRSVFTCFTIHLPVAKEKWEYKTFRTSSYTRW